MATPPPIHPGASLMLAWQVRNRRVLVIGAGPVAASRISHALNADAAVTVIAPHDDKICDEVAGRIAAGQVTHIPRAFEEGDIANDSDRQIAMVLAAVDDPEVSQRIARVCRAHRVPVNVADVPPLCDFYFAAIHRDGPVQVAVSTGGKGPRLAARVRGEIAKLLSGPSGEEREHGKKMGTVGEAVERAGRLREKLREIVPGMSEADSKARMRWISELCDSWSLEDLARMNEDDMDRLLTLYPAPAPTLAEVRGQRESQ